MTPRHLGHLPDHGAAIGADNPAVVLDHERRAYGELAEAAARFAGMLGGLGVAPGDRVALLARKSVPAVEALYGVLRAGAAYVPLDPSAPPARHAFIAGDSGARAIVGETALIRALLAAARTAGAPTPKAAVLLDEAPADDLADGIGVIRATDLAAFDAARPPHAGAEGDLAAILYTSGSTGVPKGVMLSHGNVLSFAGWAAAEFGLVAGDRVANHAPFHFDLSTFDYFATALAGAAVYPVPARDAPFPASVAGRTERDRHSVVYATPSTWIQMLNRGRLDERDLSALRVVLYAGEVFPPASLARFLKLLPAGAGCWNLYGPTETNVCTFARVTAAPPEGEPASIGGACPNCDVFAVGDDGRIAGPGGEGELHVGGSTMMQGYWNDAARTERALVPHPAGGGRVYRTGDLVRVAVDGSFGFLGRRDHQVKVRGYRVELGEIEAVLAGDDRVAEAVVVALPDPEHGAVLVGAVIPTPGARLEERELRQACSSRLPHYMVPASIAVRDVFPRTSSGKLDRLRLTEELALPASTSRGG